MSLEFGRNPFVNQVFVVAWAHPKKEKYNKTSRNPFVNQVFVVADRTKGTKWIQVAIPS